MPDKRRMVDTVKYTSMAALLIMMLMLLSSCGKNAGNGNTQANTVSGNQSQAGGVQGGMEETAERVDTGFILAKPGDYDSADTPILVAKNENDGTVTFLNLSIGRRYTLSIDGTTKLYDKYGEGISLSQVALGDIVDITFLKTKKHLTTMQLSAKAWRYTDVERYEINSLRNEVTIGNSIYKLTDNTQYLSGGRSIEKMDINSTDILSFQGIDKSILTVTVEKGHGYLRLVNEEQFIGGWIEVGQSLIQRITEDMLLTVPEGSYQVNITNNGSGGIKNVIINRNEETTLDIGDLEVAAPQTGMVLFSISPSAAKLYIDGTEADASQPIVLEYGIHQLIVKADGYKSITQYLRVGQESAAIDIVLERMDSSSTGSSTSSETSTTSTTVDTITDYYKVYINAPEGAEVFLDGSYVGISPCSFKKTAGTHVVTLRKVGYTTRSYTIQVDEEEKDISFSFADLIPSAGNEGTLGSLVSEALEALGK